jgi:hypothetical protein
MNVREHRDQAERVTVPQGAATDNGVAPCRDITAVFAAPDGAELPVLVRLFQLGDVIGVGVYPTERQGAVLRWDHGATARPTVIHWDLDGPPCGSPDDKRKR